MKFEIKSFNELSVDEMYEIAKSRFEVFVCEQKITQEQDFDDKTHHHFSFTRGDAIFFYQIFLFTIIIQLKVMPERLWNTMSEKQR